MQLFLQLSKLRGTTSYFDENVGRVGVKSDTVVVKHSGPPDLKSSSNVSLLIAWITGPTIDPNY